jgi:TRAP-type uncharacterized transport system fused permease subunit
MRGGPAKAAVVSSACHRHHQRQLHRQRGDHRHLHHPADEAGGLPARPGRRGGGVQLGQRPDHAAGDGRGGLPDGRVRGHPVLEVIKHAFLPAIISYIALLLHRPPGSAEGRPAGPAAAQQGHRRLQRLLSLAPRWWASSCWRHAVYYGIGWIKTALPDAAIYGSSALGLLAAYVGLLWVGSRQPELELDDPNAPVFELPETQPTLLSGLHYLLPWWC